MSLNLSSSFSGFFLGMDKSFVQRIYEFGDFRLDAGNLLLSRGSEDVALPPKAVATLLVLVENRGKIVSKDQLLRAVWQDVVVEESNLYGYLHLLRNTLGDRENGKPFIETLHRRGYRFNGDIRLLQQDAEDADLAWFVDNPDQKSTHIETRSGRLYVLKDWIDGKSESSSTSERSALPAFKRVESLDETDSARQENADEVSEVIQNGVQNQNVGFLRKGPYVIATFLSAVLITVLIGASFYWLDRRTELAGTGTPRKIAILPFRSLGNEAGEDILEEAMADTLVTRLGNNRSIIVRPLSSVRAFNKPGLDPIKAGQALSVDAVLEGSMQRSGGRVLVNARLMRVTDGATLWADTFDVEFTHIFDVQTAIATKMANALSVNLTRDERAALEKRHTRNAEAYQAYNLGRLHYYRITEENLRKSIAFYEQAVEADPNYALAYAGMANSYWTLAMSGVDRAKDVCPRAKLFANKALELDASIAEAHMALGWVAAIYEWDWTSSEAHFKRALELSPYNHDIHRGYAHFLMYAGRLEEAVPEIKRARELGPMTLITFAIESLMLTYTGKPDEGAQQAQNALDFEPNFWVARNMLGRAYIRQKRYTEAIDVLTKSRELSPVAQDHRMQIGYAYAMMGESRKAQDVLNEMVHLSKKQFVTFYSLAMIYNGVGQKEKAFEMLERSFKDREVFLPFINVDPNWDNLCSDPRFVSLLKRMNFQ